MAIFLRLASVTSSNARHTVGADATGPKICLWWRSTLMSEIASPPSASITATSVNTWPRSWIEGMNERRAIAVERAPVRPVFSASILSPMLPAWAITAPPSPVTDIPVDHEVRFTYGVPSASGVLNSRMSKYPVVRRHSGLSAARVAHSAMNDRGLA